MSTLCNIEKNIPFFVGQQSEKHKIKKLASMWCTHPHHQIYNIGLPIRTIFQNYNECNYWLRIVNTRAHKHCLLSIIQILAHFRHAAIICNDIIRAYHIPWAWWCVYSFKFVSREGFAYYIITYDLCDIILANISYPSRRVLLLQQGSHACVPATTSLIQFIYNILLCVCTRANSDIIKLRTTTCRTRSWSNKFQVTPLRQ